MREMREQGAGGKFLSSAPFPLPLCPMPHAQSLIYRLVISLCGTFFVKIKVELWY